MFSTVSLCGLHFAYALEPHDNKIYCKTALTVLEGAQFKCTFLWAASVYCNDKQEVVKRKMNLSAGSPGKIHLFRFPRCSRSGAKRSMDSMKSPKKVFRWELFSSLLSLLEPSPWPNWRLLLLASRGEICPKCNGPSCN